MPRRPKRNDVPPVPAAFPAQALAFFRNLARHNDRAWFAAHKQEYEDRVKTPMLEVLGWLNTRFAMFAADHVTEPKKAIYRLHRDTRFSKDKTPYKLNVSAMFGHRLLPKNNGAGYYFHSSATEAFIGVGVYMPEPPQLQALRKTIAGDLPRFRKLINEPRLKKLMGPLQGEKLVRVPKGFDADDPAAEFMRMKQFCFYKELPAKAALEKSFAKQVAQHFEVCAPFNAYLNNILLAHMRQQQGDADTTPKRPEPMF